MSDEIATPSAVEPEGGSPDTSTVETGSTPELSVSDYANYVVPVKIDGEELRVPLSEALSGYQRQADYTRKTQELAQQREQMQFAAAIQSALERDPEATIDLLVRHYGVTRSEAREMAAEVDDSSLDPAERKMRQMEQKIASFEEFQSQQQIERELSRLQAQYPDFNVAEVVNTALRTGSTDLEGTYKQMMFDKMMSQRQLETEAQRRQQEAEAAVVSAKRQAAVVSGGSNPSASATTETVEPITSIRDAWAAAKRQLGAN